MGMSFHEGPKKSMRSIILFRSSFPKYSPNQAFLLLFLLSIASSTITSSSSPSLQPSPPHLVIEPSVSGPIKPGTQVVLTCSSDPQQKNSSLIKWIVNGQPLPTLSSSQLIRRRGMEIGPGLLKIPSFNFHQQEHDGIYQCFAENQYGSVLSSEVKLESAVLSSASSPSTASATTNNNNNVIKIPAIIGGSMFIKCPPVISRPSPIYEFEFNNTKLSLTARHKLLPSGILQISEVVQADQGSYKCIAHNTVLGVKTWLDNTTFRLQAVHNSDSQVQTVKDLNVFVKSMNLIGTTRQNVTLECAASGWPKPDIHWEKYGGHLPASKILQDAGFLMLMNVQKSDAGTYLCTASSMTIDGEIIRKEVDTTITVLEPPTAEIFPSEVQVVTEGSTVTFKCKTTGSQKILIRWFFNGIHLVPEQFVTIRDSSLTLSNANRRQAGVYQCFASNSVGSAHSSVKLIITRNKLDGGFEEDEETGHHSSERITKLRGSPALSHEDNTGGYKLTKPEATLQGDSSVYLKWNLLNPSNNNNNMGLLSQQQQQLNNYFRIQMRNVDPGTKWVTIEDGLPSTSRSYVVSNNILTPGTKYRFRVCMAAAGHPCQNSLESVKVLIPLFPPNQMPSHQLHEPSLANARRKPPKPTIVEAQAISCTKIQITWQLPDYELNDDVDYEEEEEDELEEEEEEDGDYGNEEDFDEGMDNGDRYVDEGLQRRKYSHVSRLSPRGERLRGVQSFYVHYAPYQEQEKIQTLKVEEGSSTTVAILNLKPSTAYSFKMQSVFPDGSESDYSNSIVKETADCYGPHRQPHDKIFDEDHEAYYSKTKGSVRSPSGGGALNDLASQSLYVVGGVLFVAVVAALVVAMSVCLYRKKNKDGCTDKAHHMNQTLMQCYQANQLNGHHPTLGSSHLPTCNGHCTMVRTLGSNSAQGVEYCQPMELAESRALVNKMQTCINVQNAKKLPPDFKPPPPPPNLQCQKSDHPQGDDALLYDQLSDPEDRGFLRNNIAVQQQHFFQNGGLYHSLSQHNSPASYSANSVQTHQAPVLPCQGESPINAYWVLENRHPGTNFSNTPSDGSVSGGSGGYYVANAGSTGFQAQQQQQSQLLLQLQQSNAHPLVADFSKTPAQGSSLEGKRWQPTHASPTNFEPHMYRLRDGDTSDTGENCNV